MLPNQGRSSEAPTNPIDHSQMTGSLSYALFQEPWEQGLSVCIVKKQPPILPPGDSDEHLWLRVNAPNQSQLVVCLKVSCWSC